MSDLLTLPDGLVVPARGHAVDCDVFFARKRGCSCAVAREVRLRALLAELEWSGPTDDCTLPVCPACEELRPNHEPDCRLAAALRGGAS